MTRTVREPDSIARPNTNESTAAIAIPPSVAATVAPSPSRIVETNSGRLSNIAGCLALAELLGGHVVGHLVVLREPERLGDLEPLAAVPQLPQLLVETVHEVLGALAEDEPTCLDLLLAVDHRHEALGDLERRVGVVLEQAAQRDVGQRAAVGALGGERLQQLGRAVVGLDLVRGGAGRLHPPL